MRYLILILAAAIISSCSDDHSEETIPLKSFEISKTDFKILKGGIEALVLELTPPNASEVNSEWKSSDDKIATVENGVVTAIEIGTATITATIGDIKSESTVEVHDVFILKSGLDLEIGIAKQAELLVVQTTSGYNMKEITWSSADSEIVSVINKIIPDEATAKERTLAELIGTVTGVKAGTTVITATVKGVEYITNFWPTPFTKTINVNVVCK